MAAKRKAVKIDDTQRTLMVLPNSTGALMRINGSDLLSRVNRRHYHQDRCYQMQLQLSNIGSDSHRRYDVFTLSNSWWVRRSIEMAKGVWTASTKKERALLGDSKGTWNSFTIDASTGSAADSANAWQYALPSSGNDLVQTEVATDETQVESQTKASRVADADDDGYYTFGLAGADSSGDPKTLNIFDQYLLSRQITPPADTRAGPYGDIFGIEQEELEQLKTIGDAPPWDADAFPSPWVLADTIGAELNPSTTPRIVSKMLNCPLGLMVVRVTDHTGDDQNFIAAANLGTTDENLGTQFLLHYKPGSYKGVHAPVYRAMKLPASTSP